MAVKVFSCEMEVVIALTDVQEDITQEELNEMYDSCLTEAEGHFFYDVMRDEGLLIDDADLNGFDLSVLEQKEMTFLEYMKMIKEFVTDD